jgi:general secretion pathway protein G
MARQFRMNCHGSNPAADGCGRGGFTLIEVLIVVVIMAVLAGVLIPLVKAPTQDAKDATLKHSLHTMQSQLQLYRIDHVGSSPKIQEDSLPQLIKATNTQGATGLPGPDYPHGPYVAEIPPNPFGNSSKVAAVASPGKPPGGVVGTLGGWQYDETTGMIYPNNPEYFK